MQAGTINFFYTSIGSPDVFVAKYNTATNTVAPSTAIGFSPQGADGIIAGPTIAGTPSLFVAGELGDDIFQLPITGGAVDSLGTTGTSAFLLAENPAGTTLFNENNAGIITTLPITGGLISANGTEHTVTGADTNVSQLVWGMQPVGPVYYVTGGPGTNGDLGTINLSTFVTTQLFANITTAQDAVFDPFTGLIVLFGQGSIDTFNPVTNTLGTPVTLQSSCGTTQFTTGAVDGSGQALIATCGNLYYVNYSGTGNILTGAVQSTTLGGVKDLAIFPTTSVPEPSTGAFLLGGLALLGMGAPLRYNRG
ncbi:MAG: hypothetical protein M3N41_05370 [Acidobacteriota bacterium]|nr:hypothetical protein [Acidobacteriota bacterium]